MNSPLALVLGVIVEAEALLDSVIASIVAGVLVTLTASLAIYGLATFAEMRRQGRGAAMVGAGAIAVTFSLAFAATIALGLLVMIKG